MATLLADLAARDAHPENLASEGLSWVCERSSAVRGSLLGLPQLVHAEACEPNSRVGTQATGEVGDIPDIAVWDPAGVEVMLLEAKFDAGLTGNQPVTYLRRLAPGRCLFFVVPRRRVDGVWAALLRACLDAGLTVAEPHRGSLPWTAVDGSTLAVISWPALLERLTDAAITTGDAAAAEDLRQIAGLAARMDDLTFLPFTSDELTGSTGRRVVDLCNLIDGATNRLLEEADVDGRGFRAGGGHSYYGRYVRIDGVVVYPHFSAIKWRDSADTPMWCDPSNSCPATTREAAWGPLERAHPQGAYRRAGSLSVPLWVPPGAEQAEVVASLASQIRTAAAMLAATGMPTGSEEVAASESTSALSGIADLDT